MTGEVVRRSLRKDRRECGHRLVKATAWLLAATLLITANPALADTASKSAKLDELMILQGVEESAQRRLDVYKRQMVEMGTRAMEQYRTQLRITVDDPYYEQMQAAYGRFMDASSSPWTAKEATRLHADLLAKDLGEPEIDALLEFYRSPAGRKATVAANRASTESQEILGRKAQEATLAHYQNLLAEMSRVVSDYQRQRN